MILYIIRHGETEWNKMGKMQGRTDISLSEDGRKLAQKTADGLKNVSLIIFSLVHWSVPMRRHALSEEAETQKS
mgnify:CR=1 FL=1